jgi:hypothetical protein
MALSRVRRRFLVNGLKTNGFLPTIEARAAPEQGENRENRDKQGE